MAPVGNDALLRATHGVKGGLYGTLARTPGIVGMASFIKDNGGEITVDEGQIGSDTKVVELMTGSCNNRNKNFRDRLRRQDRESTPGGRAGSGAHTSWSVCDAQPEQRRLRANLRRKCQH